MSVPLAYNIELDPLPIARQPEIEGYIVAFFPPIKDPQEAIAIIVENGSRHNLRSNEMEVILQSRDAIPKEINALNSSVGQTASVSTGGSDLGPNPMLLVERPSIGSDVLLFRRDVFSLGFGNVFKLDTPNFWNMLGGKIVTFDWMLSINRLEELLQNNPTHPPKPEFPKLPYILSYEPSRGDMAIHRIFNSSQILWMKFGVHALSVWSTQQNNVNVIPSTNLSGLVDPNTPWIPMAVGPRTERWTSIVSFYLNREPHILTYDSSTGAVAINVVNTAGNGISNLWFGTWPKGWTSIVLFLLYGRPHIFSYKPTDGGRVDIYKINSNGIGTTTVWSNQNQNRWAGGWTSIVSFLLDRKPHIFSYNSNTGNAAFTKIEAGTAVEGLGSTTDAPRERGWTIIVKFYLDRVAHLLLYNSDQGDVEIDKISPVGMSIGTSKIFQGNWSKGWTSIVSFIFADITSANGIPHALLYNSSTGDVAIDMINIGGRGTTTLWRDTWLKGRLSVVSFSMKN